MEEQGPGRGGADAPSSHGKVATAMVGDVAVLTLASDKVNALDVETFEEIGSFLERSEHDAAVAALVVTGQGKVFSAGLNVRELLGNEPDYSDRLLGALEGALTRLFCFPKPTVAAINGAAIAGGCLLACACDVRVIAEAARIGVTEVQVGVAFPVLAVELLRHACGAMSERLMLGAQLSTAEEACATGMVHRQVPAGELMAVAVAQAERLASGDRRAYALAKEASRRPVLRALDSEDARRVDRAAREHWQSEETRASLGRLLEGPK